MNCVKDQDECERSPCQNGGICINLKSPKLTLVFYVLARVVILVSRNQLPLKISRLIIF